MDALARRLADDRSRLDELRIGEVTVRAGLRLSYEAQPEDAQRLLRALGTLSASVVPGWALPPLLPDGDAEAAAEELAAGGRGDEVGDLLPVPGRSTVTALGQTAAGRPVTIEPSHHQLNSRV